MFKNSNRLLILLVSSAGLTITAVIAFLWCDVPAFAQVSGEIYSSAKERETVTKSAIENPMMLTPHLQALIDRKRALEVQLELEQVQIRALAESADAERESWESALIASKETLEQTKLTLDKVMKDYEYKKVKLDADKLLLKSALKSPQQVAESDAAERSAWQNVERVRREEIEHTKTLQAKTKTYEEVKANAPRRSGDVIKRANEILKQIDSINQDIELLKTKGVNGSMEFQPPPPPFGYQPIGEPFILENPTLSTRPIPAITSPTSPGGQEVVWMPVPINRSSKDDNEYDRRAGELAQQLRLMSSEKRDQKEVEALRKVLNESFTSKQEIHEQRLAKLSAELAKTKETLEKRQASQADIVERRMNELLESPDVMSWEYDPNQSNLAANGSGAMNPPVYRAPEIDPNLEPKLQLRTIPPTNIPVPNMPDTGRVTKPRMPVYNPYEPQNLPNLLYPAPYIIPQPRFRTQPEAESRDLIQGLKPTVRETTTKNEVVALPRLLWTLSNQIVDLSTSLRKDVLEKNSIPEDAVKAVRVLLEKSYADWEAEYKKYEDSVAEITSQIAEIEKLKSNELHQGGERLFEVISKQVSSLSVQRREVSSYLNWMQDFKQNKHPEVFDRSKLDLPIPVDGPIKKPAEELVPTESK